PAAAPAPDAGSARPRPAGRCPASSQTPPPDRFPAPTPRHAALPRLPGSSASVGQPHIVFGKRALLRFIVAQECDVGLLHLEIEGALIGIAVQQAAEPPAEALGLPDAQQRFCGIAVQPL